MLKFFSLSICFIPFYILGYTFKFQHAYFILTCRILKLWLQY